MALPNADNFPTLLPQSAGDKEVTIFVSRQLCCPPLSAILRHGSMFGLRATMPKAAVYKYNEPLTRKHKVWFAK